MLFLKEIVFLEKLKYFCLPTYSDPKLFVKKRYEKIRFLKEIGFLKSTNHLGSL